MTHRLTAAVALILASSASADPYQYDLRSVFQREGLKDLQPPGLFVEPRIESALLLVGMGLLLLGARARRRV